MNPQIRHDAELPVVADILARVPAADGLLRLRRQDRPDKNKRRQRHTRDSAPIPPNIDCAPFAKKNAK